METTGSGDPQLEFSMQAMHRRDELTEISKHSEIVGFVGEEQQARLNELAAETVNYFDIGMERFGSDFMFEAEAESLALAMKGECKEAFALALNRHLYAKICDTIRPYDAIRDRDGLRRILSMVTIADRLNRERFHEEPNRVREAGDAVIGRAVQSAIALNVDPRMLHIPYRN